MSTGAAYTVVVTGVTGFIGGHVTKVLLEKGYTVRGTVRSVAKKEKYEFLTKLAEALPGKLEIVEADLLKHGSFDEAVKGATYVFHTASPFIATVDTLEDGKKLINTAVEGTKNVLESVVKNLDTVKRVVLTSSCASIMKPKSGPDNGKHYTEDDWNTDADSEDKADSYMYSKVAAERAAWELAKKHNFELLPILPSLVLGPTISNRSEGESINITKGLVEGKTSDPPFTMSIDVRDVAKAHVLAAELPGAKGRYILSRPQLAGAGECAQILADRFPQYKFKTIKVEEAKPFCDSSKTEKELGLKLIPLRESLVDGAVTLIQVGLAKPVPN